jgi:hypothetical protein
MYVVDRDFGFAPNPFHGFCTLATCMARIRAKAERDNWIVGMGGRRLKATGRCVYAMRVSDTETFDQYWAKKEYLDKLRIPGQGEKDSGVNAKTIPG